METLNLHGAWTLRQAGAENKYTARIPGDTHSALLSNGAIPDPYLGDNELSLQWLGREDWEYSRTFEVSDNFLTAASVFLNGEGIDTVAEIRINGRKAGATDNMFLRYRFEVKHLLQPGLNTITLLIKSSEKAAEAANRSLPYPIPHGKNPVQSMHRNLVRKVQCHSGWDWGPCLMVAGVYGDLSLNAVDVARIDYVTTEQRHAKDLCDVEVQCEVCSPAGGSTRLDVELGGEKTSKKVTLQPGQNLVRARVTVPNPELWWPNGYGAQPLYDLKVTIGDDAVTKKLGLRRLELITEEDKVGLSMVFRVNGVDIFCKGADWIPCDALPQRQTRAVLDNLLTSAAQAHMNMLRVWGGGQYESDDFYQLCDEKGILIWQDFMFACSLYPATPEFLDLVRREVVHQVKRLRDYACIALWCGNNENLAALGWYEESRKSRDRYLVDYDRLYEGTIGNAVDESDPTRRYWPCSPCGGRGDYSDCFHDDARGDMHYWMVWHGGKSFDAYYDVIPRFCSEFGYQSFPSLDTIRTYAPADQFNVTAPVMEHHQRNRGGNSKIIEMFSRYFRMPDGFANFVFLSQVQQGLAIKTAVEHWRHLRPVCMGTLYWQLNDNWPVCSWSSLEYGGKWKLLHYMAKRFYAPVIASAFQRESKVEVWITSDRQDKVQATVALKVIGFDGTVQYEDELASAVPAAAAKLVRKFDVNKIVQNPAAAFMLLTLTADGETFQNEHFFAPYKQCALGDARITSSVKAKGGKYEVRLSTTMPAFYVTVNAAGLRGEFDDNCFTLLPGEAKPVIFTPAEAVDAAAFKNALSIDHLRGTYA